MSKSLNGEVFSAKHGKFLLSPGLVPSKATAESVLRITNTVLKLTYGRLEANAAFKVYASDINVAFALLISVKLNVGG